jgi:pimeloyl-ACP methyl ester carboxylesterase
MQPADISTLEHFQLSDYLADFEAVREHNKLERTAMLGYSHTGFFVTHYALAMPQRVSALILMEPALFNERDDLLTRARLALEGKYEESLKAMLRYVQPDVGSDELLASRAASYIMKQINDPRLLAGELMVRAANPISPEQLTKLTMPMLLIGGSKSVVKETVLRLAAMHPHAYLWWVQGAGHGELMAERYQEQITSVIDNFLISIQLDS